MEEWSDRRPPGNIDFMDKRLQKNRNLMLEVVVTSVSGA